MTISRTSFEPVNLRPSQTSRRRPPQVFCFSGAAGKENATIRPRKRAQLAATGFLRIFSPLDRAIFPPLSLACTALSRASSVPRDAECSHGRARGCALSCDSDCKPKCERCFRGQRGSRGRKSAARDHGAGRKFTGHVAPRNRAHSGHRRGHAARARVR